MALALKKSDDDENGGKKGKSGHSLKKRLHAWWEGYELRPLEGDGDGEGTASGLPADGAGPDASEETNDVAAWSDARAQLSKIVWGEGFIAPGGEDRAMDLAQPFGLTSENTMLEIGAGPGGGACAVADKIGAYVDGFDQNGDMAKQALEMSLLKGLEGKAKVKQFEPDKLSLKIEYYDGCLVHDALIAIEDKEALLDIVFEALKPGVPLVIAEMFLTSAEPGGLAASSMAGEFGETFPCEVGRVIGKLEEQEYEIRVNNDETPDYAAMARNSWADVAARLESETLDEDLANAMKLETAMWEKRLAAFDAGELEIRRIVAFKKRAEVS